MKRTIALITLTALLGSTVSCGTGPADPQTRSMGGAIGGALIGAALTGRGKKGLTRNAWAGAAIGALLGQVTAPRKAELPPTAPPEAYAYDY